MALNDSSFWADIKKFEDTLAKDPASYCFAPLAELYRKSGLVDDAISTALKGTELHPQYFGGYMALGRAYLDKGMNSEALTALLKVIGINPENVLAQKLLAQIYMDKGENGRAQNALEAILALNPSDTESRILLESLERESAGAGKGNAEIVADEAGEPADFNFLIELEPGDDSAVDLEELELIEELEEVEDSPAIFSEPEMAQTVIVPDGDEQFDIGEEEDSRAGIRTVTIAELYVAQGHYRNAVEIYRELLEAEPANQGYRTRIAKLEQLLSEEPGIPVPPVEIPLVDEPVPELYPDRAEQTVVTVSEPESDSLDSNDELVVMLQGWLNNIRRARECRSGRD
ncbi:tetratricopeptide repeat protein [Geobacter sp. OR-1]|uniref:tetratricopeptide repeat protein n=1 Tax=Geobacter sp. OR-1 TaxID=1266765 RepID=UPI000542635A|nr:tetratricopeptide repeat protein [Geobacter sp. OR-1]GAM07836.1 tetratricopeptide repeat protein [Geobacter sp. OR-1]